MFKLACVNRGPDIFELRILWSLLAERLQCKKKAQSEAVFVKDTFTDVITTTNRVRHMIYLLKSNLHRSFLPGTY